MTTADKQKTTTVKAIIPNGQNVSGRTWKLKAQGPARKLKRTTINNQTSTWNVKQQQKRLRQEALELQRQLDEEKRQAILARKQRRLENEKRRQENELKAIQAKTLNPKTAKLTLSSMSKKQLRQIKKTRLNQKTGVVEYVPAYAK